MTVRRAALKNILTHGRECVEVAGHVCHDTALIRTYGVAKISNFQELLKRCQPDLTSREPRLCTPGYQDVLQQFGTQDACSHGDLTSVKPSRIICDEIGMNIAYLVEFIIVQEIRSVTVDQSTSRCSECSVPCEGKFWILLTHRASPSDQLCEKS